MSNRTCATCDTKYQGHKLSLYCSTKCRKVKGICADCGAQWLKSPRANLTDLCWPCARKASGRANAVHAAKRYSGTKPQIKLPHVLICKHCREPFLSERRGKKYCSDRCSKEVHANKAGYRNRVCRDCSKPLGYKSMKNMCADCRSASLRKAREINTHIKRAKHYGVHYEPVYRMEVFKRDNWTCGLCDEPVSQTTKYPDPRCASLDHVVPLSLRGEHTMENTQLAHLECNVRKGAIFNRPSLTMTG